MLNYLQQKVGELKMRWMRKYHILQLKDYVAFESQPSPASDYSGRAGVRQPARSGLSCLICPSTAADVNFHV